MMRIDQNDYEKTEEDLRKIKENKETLEKTRAQFMARRPDNFYEKISDDRKDALREQVLEGR